MRNDKIGRPLVDALGRSTGLLAGGVISINAADPTAVDISAGSGLIVDASNPSRIASRNVHWPDLAGVVMADIATTPTTFISVDDAGGVIQRETFPEGDELRDEIALGAALHENLSFITSVSQVTAAAPYQNSVTITEMGDALGVIKLRDPNGLLNLIVEGDPAGNLSIKRGAGKVFFQGINRDPQHRNTLVTPEETTPTMITVFRDGAGGFVVGNSATITAGVYDDDGGGVSAPNGTMQTNSWTNHRIYYSPDQDRTILEYGQVKYNTLADALAALSQERPVTNPALIEVPVIAAVTMRGGATDLTDPADAKFTQATKLGEF